jgi:hypothetical protein
MTVGSSPLPYTGTSRGWGRGGCRPRVLWQTPNVPLVSVVTAVRDGERYLGATIESVQRQTLSDWEHVIVDDASTDSTAALVERFAEDDKRIKLVRLGESLGSYGAANRGVDVATGAYIARLDGDDLARPPRLERQVEHLRGTPNGRASATAWQLLDADGTVEERVRPVPATSNRVLRWRLFLRSGLVHSTLLIEREAFELVGRYGPSPVAEDFRLWAKVIRNGWLAVLNEPLVVWRRHEAQVTSRAGARDDAPRLQVHHEHLVECAGPGWTIDDARDLRYLGERAAYSFDRASDLMSRWEAAWRADGALVPAERRELRRFAAGIRLRHLRHNFGGRPRAALTGAPRMLLPLAHR